MLLLTGCRGALREPAAQPVDSPIPSPVRPSETLTAAPETLELLSSDTPTPEPSKTPTSTVTPTPFVYAYGPDDFPPPINPLTGVAVEDPLLLERRPIVIKVTNYPRSVRPQWGLSRADHVYEYYIADDLSRFVGIFYGQDASRVGPIRSARLFDAHVTRMYDGIFVFGWADDIVLSFLFAPDIKPHLIVERPDNCPPLCRIGPKTAYNTLFADTSTIAEYLTWRRSSNDRQDLSGLRFEEAVPSSGNPAVDISVQFSLASFSRWEYDRQLGRYLRFQDTGEADTYEPLMDALTQEQISASNVLILFVPHQFFKKSASTEIIDTPFIGQGWGYAFRDGQVYPIMWTREAANQLPSLTLPSGDLYPLKPGNTWLEILGETSLIEQSDETAWEFVFAIP